METVIIVAGGTGSRFGGNMPKQFLPLCGKPVLMHTIDAFRSALPGSEIVVVLSDAMRGFWEELCREYGFESPRIAEGGTTRWESVKNAVCSLSDTPAGSIVLIHDGARPLVSCDVIRKTAAYARNTDGALPVVDITDSLRKMDADGVGSEPVDRSDYRSVQTPQAFSLWRLREAYALPYQSDFTDDASVMAAAGFGNIVLVEGSRENIKITTPIDLKIAEIILEERNAQKRCGNTNSRIE
ncbi:MAG: 2-C-methyl-D-erythritol 4-phosphate cytidylyltransferase [Bacteroidales bacterium]|nr:2-C-methyl-D-erythritol 4-phosphate cytidylyltransferase [Bacteroidales bacterium]